MTTTDVQQAPGAVAKGYRVVRPDGPGSRPLHTRVHAGALADGRVSLGAFHEPVLAVRLAAVLGEDLPTGTTPGAQELAVGALFLALEVAGREPLEPGAGTRAAVPPHAALFVVGERLLPLPPRGVASLVLHGQPVATYALDDREELGARLGWLAGEVGGLAAGQLVLLDLSGPAEPAAATPGCAQVLGPDGSVLAVEIAP